MYAELNGGFAFAMVDLVALYGHMVELYEGRPELLATYAMVRDAAASFDGSDPIRPLSIA